MMTHVASSWLLLFLMVARLEAIDPSYKFEGQLGSATENIHNQNSFAVCFLPYNPIIVEIGAYKGNGTLGLASAYPYGKVICFEPNPRAYEQLQQATQCYRNVYPVNSAVGLVNGETPFYLCKGQDPTGSELEPLSSLLPALAGQSNQIQDEKIAVPCVLLDSWCQANQIDHIDFLRLDTEGLELQILLTSPKILKTVIVLVTTTSFHRFRESGSLYPQLETFLQGRGFEMMGHWYRSEDRGEAIFVRKEYYDSIFR